MSLFLGILSAAVALDDSEYQKKLKGMENSSENSFKKIASAAAAFLTTTSLVNFAKSSAEAFRIQEEAIESVRASLRNLGEEAEYNTEKLSKFASEMQKITVYGDETTLAAMSKGLRLGIKPDEIEEVTQAAIGLASKIGVDLPTAMMLLARASNGQTQMLTRYGIVLDQTKSKEEQYHEILRISKDSFSLATDAAKTSTGAMMQFNNAWGDTKEVFGEQVQKSIQGVVVALTGLFTEFNNASASTKSLVTNAALLLGGLVVLKTTGILGVVKSAVAGSVAFLHYSISMKNCTKAGVEAAAQQATLRTSMAATAAVANILTAAIAATAAALSIHYMLMQRDKAAQEERLGLIEKEVDKEEAKYQAMKKNHSEDMQSLERLKELSKYQKLSSAEQKEADDIAKKLKADYDDLNISIDRVNNTVSVGADAWKKMTEEQKSRQMNEASKVYSKQLDYLEARRINIAKSFKFGDMPGGIDYEKIANDLYNFNRNSNLEQQLAYFENLRNMLLENRENEEAEQLEVYIAELNKAISLRKRFQEIKNAEVTDVVAEKEKQKSKEQRQALNELTEYEWQIVFDESDFDKQLKMLRAKAEKIFADSKNVHFSSIDKLLAADTFKLSEEELKLRKKILEIRQQEKRIVDQQKEAEKEKAEQEKKRAEEEKKRNEQERAELIKSSSKEEWDNLFNQSGFDAQLKMLDKRIYDITSRLSNEDFAFLDTIKYGDINKLTTEQIRLRKKLLDLEKQRNEVMDKRRDAEKKELERIRNASLSYKEYWKKRKEAQRDDRIMESVEKLRGKGRLKDARKLVLAEMKYYRQAAKQADEQYRSIPIATSRNKKDWAIIAAEKESSSELMRKNLEQYDRWKDVLKRLQPPDADGELDKRQERARETIGAWSLAALSRMTADSPEVQTARNTKETSRKMTELLELERQRPALTY